MLDFPLGIRVVLRPEYDKLSKMMGAQNRPITSQVVKVVHDDGNEEVQD